MRPITRSAGNRCICLNGLYKVPRRQIPYSIKELKVMIIYTIFKYILLETELTNWIRCKPWYFSNFSLSMNKYKGDITPLFMQWSSIFFLWIHLYNTTFRSNFSIRDNQVTIIKMFEHWDFALKLRFLYFQLNFSFCVSLTTTYIWFS